LTIGCTTQEPHFTRDAAVAVETAKAMIARKHNLKT